jgi:hypothetical protein
MSGVEAAGFVLAVFPIVIQLLQQYREGLEPLKTWWKYRKEFLKFSRNVKNQSLVFEGNVENASESNSDV